MLMRRTKKDLRAACQEYGLEVEGTKKDLTAALLEHFGVDEAEDVTVTLNQRAALSKPVPASSVTNAADVRDLSQRITNLDAAIQSRTQELQELWESDRAEKCRLESELGMLKEQWQRGLKDVSAGMEDAVLLHKTHDEMVQLQTRQNDLHELVEGLTRMLSLREDEVSNLTSQLEQLRQEQAAQQVQATHERLAVLALASQASIGGDAPAATLSAGARQLPAFSGVAFAYEGDGGAVSPAEGSAIRALQSAMALPAAAGTGARATAKRAQLLGMVFPGLLMWSAVTGAAGGANKAYAWLRDGLLAPEFRGVADAAATLAVISAYASVLVV